MIFNTLIKGSGSSHGGDNDRLKDIGTLPAIEDANNSLVYKTPTKYTDDVYLVKTEPRESIVDVILYRVTETGVNTIDLGDVKISGKVEWSNHTNITSPIVSIDTNITVYGTLDGEWVYKNDAWVSFVDLVAAMGIDTSEYKGYVIGTPTINSPLGLYTSFNDYFSDRKVTIINISDQYKEQGGSITVIYVDDINNVDSPVESPDELNPILYVNYRGAYTYNGAGSHPLYNDWCESVLDGAMFRGKILESPTEDSSDGVYFAHIATPVSFGLPLTEADVFQNIDGAWKQLGHKRVVEASKFPMPGETGTSGGNLEKAEVMFNTGDQMLPLTLLIKGEMAPNASVVTKLVDDHTTVASPEESTLTNFVFYVDNMGVWHYMSNQWLTLFSDIPYKGILWSPLERSEEPFIYTLAKSINGSIWLVQEGMCVDMTVAFEAMFGLSITSYETVDDHTTVASPLPFDMTTLMGPAYVDDTDMWVYTSDTGEWVGFCRDLLGSSAEMPFFNASEAPTAESPVGLYFVSAGDAVADPNFVSYDQDLIYKVVEKDEEVNLYWVSEGTNNTKRITDFKDSGGGFGASFDFIFVEDHNTVEKPIISLELGPCTFYIDNAGIWWFSESGGWICKTSTYTVVSEPPTHESDLGYYLLRIPEKASFGIANSSVSVRQYNSSKWEPLVEQSLLQSDPRIVFMDNAILEGKDNEIVLTGVKNINYQTFTIPDFVTEIGEGVFRNGASLHEVKIPNSVTAIGDNAFYLCTNLTEHPIGDNVETIGDWAYYCVVKPTELCIPNSVVTIGYSAFAADTDDWHVSQLTNLVFEKNSKLETIGERAFARSKKLESISLPNSVTSIGENAFEQCRQLANIELGDNIVSIGRGAFDSDTAYANNESNWENNILYIGKYLISARNGADTIKDGTLCIADYAFYDTDITSVVIPESTTVIGKYAFYYSSLTDVTISESTTTIGEQAFGGYCYIKKATIPTFAIPHIKNSELQEVVITSGESIDDEAFYGCQKLVSVDLPNTITSIGNNAFERCDSLISIEIPDSVTSIGDSAFYSCDVLTNIVIPDSVTSIGDKAFYWCSGLTSVGIGDGVTSIGEHAFYNCNNLTGVYITDVEAWCNISFGDIYANPLYYAKNLYLNNELVTELTIPDSVTSISNYVFYNCTSLTDITIPDSVAEIGANAFTGCVIENATIPAMACRQIRNENLKSVVITSGDTIPYQAFQDCTNLTSVVIPDSVTTIDSQAFYNCSGLTNMEIGSGIKTISSNAFTGCNIENIKIPATTCSYIKNVNVKSIEITEGDKIPSNALLNCHSVVSVKIGDSVTSIGSYAFGGCSSLTNIEFSDNITTIGPNAFQNCDSLVNITIPNSVTSIGSHAFSGCDGLTSVAISDSITSIDASIFYYCTSLAKVVIGDSVTSIGGSAFSYCTSLTSIEIPDSVISIGESAFSHCESLTSVTIGDSVTSIGWSAFRDCSNLMSVYYKGTAEDWSAILIDNTNGHNNKLIQATRYYYSETQPITEGNYWHYVDGEIIIWEISPEPEEPVGSQGLAYTLNNDGESYAVNGIGTCTDADLIIPSAYEGKPVTSISSRAFSGCSELTSIEIPDGVTSIGTRAFYDCASLTSVVIPDSVETIGDSAFTNCTSLMGVIIPDRVTLIGEGMFHSCHNLTSVVIPDSVTSIKNYAFYYCVKLTDITYNGTKAQWNSITKETDWNTNTGTYTIHCTDGDIAKS